MNVLYIDDDDEFRERFSGFIASAVDGLVLTADSGERFLESGQGAFELEAEKYDLILLDESVALLDRIERLGCGPKTVVLSAGDRGNTTVGNGGIRNVFKYQRVSSLISSIAELAAAAVPAAEFRTDRDMETVLVTGFGGGCGRTSFALMYARLLKRITGRSALILSAERTGDINDYFRTAGDRSDMNLLLLNFSSGIAVLPQRFIAEDDYGASSFVMPEDAVSDLGDLSADMMLKFREMIGGWKLFDTLIVDMNPQLTGACAPFVRSADKMFVIHNRMRKTHRAERVWCDMLAEMCRGTVRHVVNFADEGGEDSEIFIDEAAERDNDYSISCRIASDPESFFIRDGTADISMTGEFSRSVGSIIEEA